MTEERRATLPMVLIFSLPCLGCVGSLLTALLALFGTALLHFGWLSLLALPVVALAWAGRRMLRNGLEGEVPRTVPVRVATPVAA